MVSEVEERILAELVAIRERLDRLEWLLEEPSEAERGALLRMKADTREEDLVPLDEVLAEFGKRRG